MGNRTKAEEVSTGRRFDFDADTFAYANELVWEYQLDPQTGKQAITKRHPPPLYAHHCVVLVRAARQFFLHAAFQADRPPLESEAYVRLIRAVISRSPRHGCPAGERIVFPGFADLRRFSQAEAPLLRAHCGGAWQSYAQRGNWRMVLPFSRSGQERLAGGLVESVQRGGLPIIHVVSFPRLTINHTVLLIDAYASPHQVEFMAYDPNLPERPLALWYNGRERTFEFPRTHYFLGGRVNVYEIYRGLIF